MGKPKPKSLVPGGTYFQKAAPMAKLNRVEAYTETTHEGAPAKRINAIQQLRRSVLSCLLWEDEFYEDGVSISERIALGAATVFPGELATLAVEARTKYNLRHVPLLLLCALAARSKECFEPGIVGDTIAKVISRADELAEFLVIYAKQNGVNPGNLKSKLSAQVKKGMARAFTKFDGYQLAKYDRQGAVRMRDALFLCHAKPENAMQEALWKALVDGTLPVPDTWEVALSTGRDKKESFERLLREQKMGYLALLRNLRGMTEAGVDERLIIDALIARKGAHRVLPFRFVAAARACPQLEPAIDVALQANILSMPKLKGKTAVLVDVSGSMDAKLSAKSDLRRMDAAAALGAIVNGEYLRVFTFSSEMREVPPRRGMAGVDAIMKSQPHSATYLGEAVQAVNGIAPDRIIVITDEQSHTKVPDPVCNRAYMINVASAKNGVGYGKWTHIDGFSEHVLRFISEVEDAA